MVHSMTAFTRQQLDKDYGSLAWEIRSVNHRYLEVSVRLPESLRALENTVRDALRQHLSRGKVECQLRLQTEAANGGGEMEVDEGLATQLIDAAQRLNGLAQDSGARLAELSITELLRWPGVVGSRALDTAAIQKDALALFDTALADLVATRQREGSELAAFISQRCEAIRALVAELRVMMPEILEKQRTSLLERVEALAVELEPTRLEQEIALLTQKADVDEELDRLGAHINEVERVLTTDEQKGRRLDFLMQELNREANTLSSKSIVVETTRSAVDLKVLIEQMREQIQNIE